MNKSVTRSIELQFHKKWIKATAPTKSAIKKYLDKGESTQAAVIKAFHEHNLRKTLTKLVLDAVESAYEKGKNGTDT